MGLGVAIGLGGALVLTLGSRQSSFPAQLLDVSAAILVFVAAGCALASGAVVRRAANRLEEATRTASERASLGAADGLGEMNARESRRVRVRAS
jgi:hypothetical protein